PENGVRGGNGTEEDPYIIEGYHIDGSPLVPTGTGGYIEKQYNYCIYVGNTTKYFIIRNCYLEGARWPYEPVDFGGGVTLFNVTAGTVKNITAYDNKYGIYLRKCSNVTITNIVATENHEGVGVLDYCSNNTLTNIVAENNTTGFNFCGSHSHHNILSNSITRYNTAEGLSIASSTHNTFTNIISSNNGHHGVYVKGNYNLFENITTINNDANGVSIVYNLHGNDLFNINTSYNGQAGIRFDRVKGVNLNGAEIHFNVEYGIEMVSSDNNNIKNAFVTHNNMSGVYLKESSHNSLSSLNTSWNRHEGVYLSHSCDNNRLSFITSRGNLRGIYISMSSNNLITYCTFEGNRNYSVEVYGSMMSEGNTIHHNNFINNNNGSTQANDMGSRTRWNDTFGEGNFWSDYTARYPNATNNGHVWDTPYDIDGGMEAKDFYPLVGMVEGEGEEDHYPPVADAGLNRTVSAGEEVTFDASGSYDPDPQGGVANYTWTFQYNGTEVTLYGQVVVFTFEFAGVYVVTLTVTDLSGKSATDSIAVRVVTSMFEIRLGPVIYDDGTAVTDAEVSIVGLGYSRITQTDPSGHITMENASAGVYNVTIRVGGRAYTFTVTVYENGTSTYNLPVIPKAQYPPPENVTITIGPVKDSEGNPLSGVSVIAVYGGMEYVSVTGEDGIANLNLPSEIKGENISITLKKRGYSQVSFNVHVDDQGNVSGNVPLMESTTKGEKGGESWESHTFWFAVILFLVAVLATAVFLMRRRRRGGVMEE
ncbi:MAG: right-handed parallel beta-helix repeat-containing protein, partial [Thermoplasmata archaeon]|nr:right-handed parallel beta-helix repeat-containing protein [Thermoplasmata archaeon]